MLLRKLTSASFPAGRPRQRSTGHGAGASDVSIARQHLPFDRTAELFSDWLGANISAGTLASYIATGAEDPQGLEARCTAN